MKVALIDDQPTILTAYSIMLLKTGAIGKYDELTPFQTPGQFFAHYVLLEEFHRLKFKNTLNEANEEFNKLYSFDVVICDHNLGENELNGFSLLFHLQEHGFKGLAVLLTSDNSEEMLHRVKHTPTINYVFKGGKMRDENPYILLKKLIDQARSTKHCIAASA